MRRASAFAVVAALAVPWVAAGHGGGLDRNGCHTNRKTGDYHCHGGGLSQPSAPSRSSTEPRPKPAVQRVAAEGFVVQTAPTSRAKDLVRAAQVLLRALGYKPSSLGALDERTREAVRAFQRARNLEATGAVDEYLVLRLAEAAVAKCQ